MRIFWRACAKQEKGYTLLKVFGLTVGLVTVLYIFLWANYQFNFDKHFSKTEQIFRLSYEVKSPERTTHFARISGNWVASLPILKDEFPEIIDYVRLAPLRKASIKIDERKFYIRQALQKIRIFIPPF